MRVTKEEFVTTILRMQRERNYRMRRNSIISDADIVNLDNIQRIRSRRYLKGGPDYEPVNKE